VLTGPSGFGKTQIAAGTFAASTRTCDSGSLLGHWLLSWPDMPGQEQHWSWPTATDLRRLADAVSAQIVVLRAAADKAELEGHEAEFAAAREVFIGAARRTIAVT
jgi:hypothetical protein